MKIDDERKTALREIAKEHGLLIGRGREAEWGSIRKLLFALADGDLQVRAKSPQD